jgi:hypothetical protein
VMSLTKFGVGGSGATGVDGGLRTMAGRPSSLTGAVDAWLLCGALLCRFQMGGLLKTCVLRRGGSHTDFTDSLSPASCSPFLWNSSRQRLEQFSVCSRARYRCTRWVVRRNSQRPPSFLSLLDGDMRRANELWELSNFDVAEAPARVRRLGLAAHVKNPEPGAAVK